MASLNDPRIERRLVKVPVSESRSASSTNRAINLPLRDSFQLTLVVVMPQASWLGAEIYVWRGPAVIWGNCYPPACLFERAPLFNYTLKTVI